MIMRKLGFTTEDFANHTLPELYLRLCLTSMKGDI